MVIAISCLIAGPAHGAPAEARLDAHVLARDRRTYVRLQTRDPVDLRPPAWQAPAGLTLTFTSTSQREAIVAGSVIQSFRE